jgi:hypothetical protein
VVKTVCALASSAIGKTAAQATKTDAQTNPVLFADFIAPSPDVLLIVGAIVP